MQFVHGIYAIREADLKVISLDPRDASLTRRQLKTRLRGLIDSSMTSPTIPLVYERARSRGYLLPFVAGEGWPSAMDLTFDELRQSERPYECLKVPAPQPRTVYVSNGDGTFHEETTIHQFPGNQYKINCIGYMASIPLFFGNYTLVRNSDYLTGRVTNGMYQVGSHLSNPL